MARDKIYQEEEFPSPIQQLWQSFRETPVVMVGFCCFCVSGCIGFVFRQLLPHTRQSRITLIVC